MPAIVLPTEILEEIWMRFWSSETHLVLCLVSKALLELLHSRRFIKRLQMEGNSSQRMNAAVPLAIPMAVACFNHSRLCIEILVIMLRGRSIEPVRPLPDALEEWQVSNYSSRYSIGLHSGLDPTVTDEPLTPKDLIRGLLHGILNLYHPKYELSIMQPLLKAGRRYKGEVLIPLAEKDVVYDAKTVTKHLGKTNIATSIFGSDIREQCEDIIPSIAGIKSQSRKKREFMLRKYLAAGYRTAFLCTEMWVCFPKARKMLFSRANGLANINGFFHCESMNYETAGIVDGSIIMNYLRCRSFMLDKYQDPRQDTALSQAIEMLLVSKTIPGAEDVDAMHFVLVCMIRIAKENPAGSDIINPSPIARYLLFLGMDKIVELGLHDIVCKFFGKTYSKLVIRPGLLQLSSISKHM